MTYKLPYLQPYTGRDSRTTCPSCKKPYSFTLYLDGETNQPINPLVGICNHVNSCGYHYTPKQYFIDNPERSGSRSEPIWFNPINPINPIGYIPDEYMEKSISPESDFVQFLRKLFDGKNVPIDEVLDRYKVGATKDRKVIFWQIDADNRVRTGKMMKYNPETGKRVHDQSGAIDWVHNQMKKNGSLPDDFNLVQCYFGEHLLKKCPDKMVAIVESEKTAIISSCLFPEYVWLAAGNLNGLTVEKSKVLRGRSVILFPDLSKKLPNRPTAYEQWSKKANEIRRAYGCKVTVSDLLERTATDEEKESGLDIVDYFIKQLSTQEKIMQQSPPNEAAAGAIQYDECANEIDEMEAYFNDIDLPDDMLKSKYLTVCYPRLFVKKAIKSIRNNDGNVKRLWDILREMKNIIENGLISV